MRVRTINLTIRVVVLVTQDATGVPILGLNTFGERFVRNNDLVHVQCVWQVNIEWFQSSKNERDSVLRERRENYVY